MTYNPRRVGQAELRVMMAMNCSYLENDLLSLLVRPSDGVNLTLYAGSTLVRRSVQPLVDLSTTVHNHTQS